MKRLLAVMITALLLVGCVPSRKLPPVKKNIVNIESQQEEYELLVLDPGFETWFQATWSPAKDRSKSYYQLWNQRYVSAWNYKSTLPHTSEFFDTIIQYDPTIDYGMEVQRKLYYYFRWVDTRLGIPILDRPPPAGIL